MSAVAVADPVFSVLDVEPVRAALAPTLRFHLHVDDPTGRETITIALSTQIQVEPARRVHDEETRRKLTDLFGAPERWAATTHPFQWARVESLVPGFTGATSFAVDVPCTYDMEVAATKYFSALPDGEVPLTFHFSGMALYRGDEDRLQVRPVPWSCHAEWRMPVAAWRGLIADAYPGGGWVALDDETLGALRDRALRDGDRSLGACIARLVGPQEDAR